MTCYHTCEHVPVPGPGADGDGKQPAYNSAKGVEGLHGVADGGRQAADGGVRAPIRRHYVAVLVQVDEVLSVQVHRHFSVQTLRNTYGRKQAWILLSTQLLCQVYFKNTFTLSGLSHLKD